MRHADAFISGMQLCGSINNLNKGCQDSFSTKTGILFPLIAFEQKITYVLELQTIPTMVQKNDSSILKHRPYSLKRPKITVTMEELDNYESDEDFYLPYEENFLTLGRKQPKRNCKTNENSIQNDNEDFLCSDENILDKIVHGVEDSDKH